MKTTTLLKLAAAAALTTASGLLLAGCATSHPAASTGTSGAQLWANNCMHCHNSRSPSSYSDAQWEVATMHMRVRANLTAEEHREILAFLKSAH
jgi:mono/diheme cytochrome c family protein